MSARLTLATAARVLRQVRADPRTIAMILLVPCVLMGLLAWIFHGRNAFDELGPPLLGVFPFVVMFLVTSVTTLRERTSGTLERLLSTPLHRGDFLAGYALAFGVLATVQAVLATGFAVWVCGMQLAGSAALLVLVAVLDAVLGATTGLFVSAFARTEFQAVQFMPALVLPQFLLCGLLVPRGAMPSVLQAISDVLPLTYAVDAMVRVADGSGGQGQVLVDLFVVGGFALLAVGLGSLTLRRRTA